MAEFEKMHTKEDIWFLKEKEAMSNLELSYKSQCHPNRYDGIMQLLSTYYRI